MFVHDIDPSYPEDQQKLLNEIHNGKSKPYFNMTENELDEKFGQDIRPRC